MRVPWISRTVMRQPADVIALVQTAVNLPIIYYAAIWWNTLHQGPSTIGTRTDGANPPEIWIPIFFTGWGLTGLIFLVVIMRTRNEILRRERWAQWVVDLMAREALHV